MSDPHFPYPSLLLSVAWKTVEPSCFLPLHPPLTFPHPLLLSHTTSPFHTPSTLLKPHLLTLIAPHILFYPSPPLNPYYSSSSTSTESHKSLTSTSSSSLPSDHLPPPISSSPQPTLPHILSKPPDSSCPLTIRTLLTLSHQSPPHAFISHKVSPGIPSPQLLHPPYSHPLYLPHILHLQTPTPSQAHKSSPPAFSWVVSELLSLFVLENLASSVFPCDSSFHNFLPYQSVSLSLSGVLFGEEHMAISLSIFHSPGLVVTAKWDWEPKQLSPRSSAGLRVDGKPGPLIGCSVLSPQLQRACPCLSSQICFQSSGIQTPTFNISISRVSG